MQDDRVSVLIEFGSMTSEDETEHVPFICMTIEGDEPIHFHCDHAFESEEDAKKCLEAIEAALRAENAATH